MAKFNFEDADNANYEMREATPFYLEGSYSEDGINTNVKKIFLSNYFPSSEVGYFRYINKYVALVEKTEFGVKTVTYNHCNKVSQVELTADEFLQIIQNKVDNIDSFYSIPEVFSIKFAELKEFSAKFKGLCEKLESSKKEFEKTNKIISAVPSVDFKQLAVDFNSFVVVLEDYLLTSFKHKIMQTMNVNSLGSFYKYYFYPNTEIASSDAQKLLDACTINFSSLSKAIFVKEDFSKIVTNQDEFTQTEDVFANWVDIKSVEFSGGDVEKFLLGEKQATIEIYRPFLYSDYESVRDELTKTFIRGIFENFKVIKSFYFEENIPVDWQDFCSAFMRPAINLTYEPKTNKTKDDRKNETLKAPLKTLKQKTDEDKKIAKERREKAEANANRKEDPDTGILSTIIKELKNTVDKDGLYEVLQKVVLKNLVEASKDCIGEFAVIPNIKIPNIELPSFDFSYKIQTNDVSGGMYKKIIDQMIKVSFENVVKTVEKFFTVKDCEDLKQILSKDKYKSFYASLKDSIKKDFDAIVENLKQSLKDLAEQLQKDFCNAELYLVTLYGAEKVLAPDDVLGLLSGMLDNKKSMKFLDFMNINKNLYFPNEVCGTIEPSELNILYSSVGELLVDWKDGAEDLIVPSEPDVAYQSSIKCENAFDSFVEWMRENGFSKDVINCVVEKSTEEKSQFLLDLYNYVNTGGVSEAEQVQVEDESAEDTANMLFDSNFAFWFDNWSDIIKNYKSLSKSTVQPLRSGLQQRVRDTLAGFERNDTGVILGKIENVLNDEDLTFEGTTEFDTGKIGGGSPFWDSTADFNEHPDRFDIVFDKTGLSFVLQYELIDRHIEKVQFSRSNNDFFFPQQQVVVNNELSFPVYQEVVGWNKNLTENITQFDSYSNIFRDFCINNVPTFFTERIGLFDKFISGDLYNYLQRKFSTFIKGNLKDSSDFIFGSVDIVKPDGTKIKVSGFDLFCSYVEKLDEVPDKDFHCSPFSKEQWKNMFVETLGEVFKDKGNYDQSVILNKFGLKIKARLFALFFRLAVPSMLQFFNETGNFCVNGYFKAVFGEEFKKFFDGDYKFDDFGAEVEVNLVKNYERFEIEKYLETPDALDLKFPGFVNNSYVFPELELNKYITSNMDIVSRCFSSMLNKEPVGVFDEYLNHLQFRQFNDYVNFDVRGVSINSHYNNIGLIEDRCDLFLEVVYEEGGIRKAFGLTGATRDFSPIKNQFVNYAPTRPYEVFNLLDSATLNKIDKLFVNVSFAQFNYPTLHHIFGSGVDDIGYILPIIKLEITKQDLKWLLGKYSGFDGSLQAKVDMQNEFLQLCRDKVYDSEAYKKQFVYTLALDKIYECFNLLLFNINIYSTNLEQLFSFKANGSEEELQNLEQYDANASVFKNDTFGMLRKKFALSDVQKLALKMALDAPKLIFKAQVETTDPNIMLARRIVDTARLAGKELDIRFVSLMMLLPVNLWAPLGYGPPITPQGLVYLFLDLPGDEDKKGNIVEEFGTFENEVLKFYEECLSYVYVPCEETFVVEEQLKPETCLAKNNS